MWGSATLTVGIAVLIAGVGCRLHGTWAHVLDLLVLAAWLLIGLTAIAWQLERIDAGDSPPSWRAAFAFAGRRVRAVFMLPVWCGLALLALFAGEALVLLIAHIPGLGLLWLAAWALPLMLINAAALMAFVLVWLHLAAVMALDPKASARALRDRLFACLQRSPLDILARNLGGLLVAALATAMALAPLAAGAMLSNTLAHALASGPLDAIMHPSGLWSGTAYLVLLLSLGLASGIMAGIPLIAAVHAALQLHRLNVPDAPQQSHAGPQDD